MLTWHGCTLRYSLVAETAGTAVDMQPYAVDISENLAPRQILNVFGGVERLRADASSGHRSHGPIVLLCGPTDVGKSTTARVLVNYTIRADRPALLADIDVGQGEITIAGFCAMNVITRAFNFEADADVGTSPITFHYGSTSPQVDSKYYLHAVRTLAATMHDMFAADAAIGEAGAIVNTCGWVDGEGLDVLRKVIAILGADVVLVVGDDRLYTNLKDLDGTMSTHGNKLAVGKISRSGAVVVRDALARARTRDRRVRDYFYGPFLELQPSVFKIKWADFVLLKVRRVEKIDESVMPVGYQEETAADEPDKLLEHMRPDSNLRRHILAVSSAEREEDVASSAIYGYICVEAVDDKRSFMQVLAPCPLPLPGRFLLLTGIKFEQVQ